jgi:hypothetical protein
MSGNDQVKAERAALQTLRGAVTRYAEQLRAAMGSARRDADVLVKRAEEAERKRRADLDRAVADLKQAEAALARCRDEQQAAALRGEAAAKRRYADERRQLLGYAKQAVKTAADARSDLLKVIQAQEPAVGEHAVAAAGALAQIESRLAGIDPGSLGARAVQGIKGLTVAGAFFADTVIGAGHVAHLAQTFANGYDTVDGHPATSQEIRLEQAASGSEYLAASDLKDRETRDEKLGLRP